MPTPPVSDISDCDREPIHLPGSIQPHGFLLVVDKDQETVVQASVNSAAWLFDTDQSPLGAKLGDLFVDLPEHWKHDLRDDEARLLATVRPRALPSREYCLIGHRVASQLVLEFELAEATLHSSLGTMFSYSADFLAALRRATELSHLHHVTAAEARKLIGFDRVLIYQFADDWHGTVIAEARNDKLPSLQGHHFPASDIPQQAQLYQRNRLRLIADAGYEPVPILPATHPMSGEALDLTFSVLRSVSPVHVEYLRNMQTAASMSISIVRQDRLWGLIACHHSAPMRVPYVTCAACDLLAQILASQLDARLSLAEDRRRLELKTTLNKLLHAMASAADFRRGLLDEPQLLLDFGGSTGFAIVDETSCELAGETPDENQVRGIVDWLRAHENQDLYATNDLATEYAPAAEFSKSTCGLMAISISPFHRQYVLWFRGEIETTVCWAGDPRKPSASIEGRLHPRKSFALWRETVRGKSAPFLASELEAAKEFRNAVVGIVLEQAETKAELSAELQRSNQELEAFSYSISHDLRAPFRHIAGYSELLRERVGSRFDAEDLRHLETIIEAAQTAGLLVDNLLSYSRMGRTRIVFHPIDMNLLVREVQKSLQADQSGRQITWQIDSLPVVSADASLLRAAVRNLLENAVKFTRQQPQARIHVGVETTDKEYIFSVADNGTGFEMKYVDKLFGVFQRLHRVEDFEGTGIGLANVAKIIARHHGRTWATGEPGKGATFYFSLPISTD